MRGGELDQAEVGPRAQSGGQGFGPLLFRHQGDALASQQRREEAGHAQIEAQRRMQGRARAGAGLIGLATPAQVIEQSAVKDHRPLGLAGGAGGIDDVGQVLASHATERFLLALAGDALPVAIEAHDRLGHRGQLGQQALLRQEQLGVCILQHESQALLGRARLQRQVGAAGLENAEEAHHHLR